MASRRLDISSLLCDDNQPPAFSPLEALAHAATEERKRLVVDEPRPSSSSGSSRPPLTAPPTVIDLTLSSPESPHPARNPFNDGQRIHLQPQPPPFTHRQRPQQDNQDQLHSQQQQQRQQQHRSNHQSHRSFEFESRILEAERRRAIQEAEQLQRLQEQRRMQELEIKRQQEHQQLLRAQHIERLRREEEHRVALEKRQQRERDRERDERREADRLQAVEYQRQQLALLDQQRREVERQQRERIELRAREAERPRETERQRQQAAERQRVLELQQTGVIERQRQLEWHRLYDLNRLQQQGIQDGREPQPPNRFHDAPNLAPVATAAHPQSISHLISHPPRRNSDSLQITHPTSPIDLTTSPTDDYRPIKKRRYSQSPTRPSSDDKERIAREREKMVVGELGYGRVDSPVAGPSSAPRRPGSGNGGQVRKVAPVMDFLVDKGPTPIPRAESNDAHHRVRSPLGSMGRRSPPGSQVGRAKAARKSDEFLSLSRESLPPPTHISTEFDAKKTKEEPRTKHDLKPSRSRQHSDEARTPVIEDRLKKTSKEPLPPPSFRPQPGPSRTTQDDAHEWFLHQYDEVPSPSMSTRVVPPHSPSPSISPLTSTVPASIPKSSPAPRKSLTPITANNVSLEQELEDLVSTSTVPVGPIATTTTTTVIKQQEPDDMDLDVDLAVTELVETMENDDVKDVGMEVDVEDELLSLVDDSRQPASNSARRASGTTFTSTSHASATPAQATAVVNAKQYQIPPPIRAASEATHPSPPALSASLSANAALSSASAVRHPSTRPASERGSMPPPATTTKAGAAKKGANGVVAAGEGSTTTTTTTATKKKKETTAKAANAKSKAASASSATASNAAAKAKGKGTTAKAKKAAAEASAAAAGASSVTASKPPKAPAGKKTASRSRSTSVMPTGSASVGPESDAVKAEKQEEEEDSDADNEDDKLYCVCKTKYDEDRFMIACDRCDEWYHTQCVSMPDLEVDLVDQFICPPCVEKNPQLNLRTTYKQRCLYGQRHSDPNSPKACHKAARGAFSKYCSDECGVKYMQTRIDNYAKKGGKTEKLWESVKHAEKREGVVVCAVEPPEANGCVKMDVDVKQETDIKPLKSKIVQPSKTKVQREAERLNSILDAIVKMREEIKRGMEVILWRERLLQLASERAEHVGQCGWDQRLCIDDEEWVDQGATVLETYEETKSEGGKEDGADGEMEVDNAEEPWWCPGQKVCERHAGWQTVRYKDVCKEKEKKEEALAKLTVRERELRKQIEDVLDPKTVTPIAPTTIANTNAKDNTTHAPLKSSSTKVNGHPKSKASAATTEKKGKKRKAPTA